MAHRRLRDETASIDDLLIHLTSSGRAVAELLLNRSPERVPALLAALPGPMLAELHALDLARADLAGLHARLLLVHGRKDAIVPVTHALALAEAAPHAELFLIDSLRHVDPAFDPADLLSLWRVAYRLLAWRDGALPSPAASDQARPP